MCVRATVLGPLFGAKYVFSAVVETWDLRGGICNVGRCGVVSALNWYNAFHVANFRSKIVSMCGWICVMVASRGSVRLIKANSSTMRLCFCVAPSEISALKPTELDLPEKLTMKLRRLTLQLTPNSVSNEVSSIDMSISFAEIRNQLAVFTVTLVAAPFVFSPFISFIPPSSQP